MGKPVEASVQKGVFTMQNGWHHHEIQEHHSMLAQMFSLSRDMWFFGTHASSS